jgi:hypothetical protein
MRDAVECNNKYAVLKLIDKFGLKDTFLEDMKMEFLEHYLHSKISSQQGGAIKIDYTFMKQESWINLFIKFLENNEIKDLITHPAVSVFIEYKSRRFIKLHTLSLIMYLLLFVLPIGFTFFTTDENVKEICWITASVYSLIINLLSNPQGNKSIFASLFDLKVSFLDRVLLASTVLATTSLHLENHKQNLFEMHNLYKSFFIITILMGSIKLMLLFSAVYRTLAIYLYMLWTVTQTFFKMLGIFGLFTITFTICFCLSFKPNLNISSGNETASKQTIGTVENTTTMEQHPFVTTGLHSFVKTILMFGGEYEATELKYDNDYFTTALVGVFILMAIILYNFVNALAISDVQILRDKAEFFDLKLKILAMEKITTFLFKMGKKDISIRKWFLKKIIPQSDQVISAIHCYSEGSKLKTVSTNTQSKNELINIEVNQLVSKDIYGKLKGVLKKTLNVNENIRGSNERNELSTGKIFSGINELNKQAVAETGKLEAKLEKQEEEMKSKVLKLETKIESLTSLVENVTKTIKSIDKKFGDICKNDNGE